MNLNETVKKIQTENLKKERKEKTFVCDNTRFNVVIDLYSNRCCMEAEKELSNNKDIDKAEKQIQVLNKSLQNETLSFSKNSNSVKASSLLMIERTPSIATITRLISELDSLVKATSLMMEAGEARE